MATTTDFICIVTNFIRLKAITVKWMFQLCPTISFDFNTVQKKLHKRVKKEDPCTHFILRQEVGCVFGGKAAAHVHGVNVSTIQHTHVFLQAADQAPKLLLHHLCCYPLTSKRSILKARLPTTCDISKHITQIFLKFVFISSSFFLFTIKVHTVKY